MSTATWVAFACVTISDLDEISFVDLTRRRKLLSFVKSNWFDSSLKLTRAKDIEIVAHWRLHAKATSKWFFFCSTRNFEWRNLNKFHCSFMLSRGDFCALVFLGASDKNGFFNFVGKHQRLCSIQSPKSRPLHRKRLDDFRLSTSFIFPFFRVEWNHYGAWKKRMWVFTLRRDGCCQV